jgi:hypothetical protein
MKRPSNLSESLHHRLNSYALAASAAGVGMLALAQPAEAKIVYTRAHKPILGHGRDVMLDLNHDGIVDFVLRRGSSARYTTSLRIYPEVRKNDYIWGTQSQKGTIPRVASALPAHFNIRPSKHFSNKSSGDGALMWWQYSKTSTGEGQWGPQNKNPYLGLQFKIKGRRHYGWARVQIIDGYYYLTGYAYETVPGKPIITGKTHGPDVITLQDASLGHLARGASAMQAWRAANSAK